MRKELVQFPAKHSPFWAPKSLGMSLREPGEEEALAAKLAFAADVGEEEAPAPKENGGSSNPQQNGSGNQQEFDDVRFLCHATLEKTKHPFAVVKSFTESPCPRSDSVMPCWCLFFSGPGNKCVCTPDANTYATNNQPVYRLGTLTVDGFTDNKVGVADLGTQNRSID